MGVCAEGSQEGAEARAGHFFRGMQAALQRAQPSCMIGMRRQGAVLHVHDASTATTMRELNLVDINMNMNGPLKTLSR